MYPAWKLAYEASLRIQPKRIDGLLKRVKGLLCALGLSVLLAACSVAPVKKQWTISANGEAIHDAVLEHHDEWRGAPYRLGGSSRSGIDCSAYMQRLFSDQFAVRLPRTTLEQMRMGETVSRNTLEAGDLLFFQPSSKGRHVGVYLSEGFFVHAGTSTGVTISDLNNNYWRSSYVTAKRVLVQAP